MPICAKNRTYIVFGIIFGILPFVIPYSVFIYSIIILLGFAVGAILIYKHEPKEAKTLMKIFIAGFLLRLIVCILLSYLAYLKKGNIFFLGADDYGYAYNASKIVAAWRETGYLPGSDSLWWMPWAGDLTYSYWLSFLYYFIGEYYFMSLFINCAFGSLSIIFVYLIAKEIFNYRVAILSSLLMLFWPSMILWSTQNLKESLTVFIIVLVFWILIKLKQHLNKLSYWIISIFSLSVIYKIRKSIAIILFLTSILFLAMNFFKNKLKFGVILFLIFLMLVANWNYFNRFFNKSFGSPSYTVFEALNQAHKVRVWAADTAFLVGVDISTPGNFLRHLPKFLLYIIFSPLPWEMSKAKHLFGSLEMLIWFLLFPFALRGIFLSIRYKIKQSFSLLIFLFIMLFSLIGEGNTGTIFRHRALIWPCWFIFTSVGLTYGVKNHFSAYFRRLEG